MVGFLYISLLSGTDLHSVENEKTSTFDKTIKSLSGTINPFCEFRLFKSGVSKSVKSRKVKKTLNPQWNDQLVLEVEDLTAELTLYVWNWNKLMGHSPLGEVPVEISDLSSTPKEFKLELQKSGKGVIHFSIRYGTQLEKAEVIHSGQLGKQSRVATVWQTRHFELQKDGLYWSQPGSSNQILGAIKDFSKCALISDIHKTDLRDIIATEKGFFFSIQTPTKTYYLKAKSEEDRNEWVEAINTAGCPIHVDKGTLRKANSFIAPGINNSPSSPSSSSSPNNLSSSPSTSNSIPIPSNSNSNSNTFGSSSPPGPSSAPSTNKSFIDPNPSAHYQAIPTGPPPGVVAAPHSHLPPSSPQSTYQAIPRDLKKPADRTEATSPQKIRPPQSGGGGGGGSANPGQSDYQEIPIVPSKPVVGKASGGGPSFLNASYPPTQQTAQGTSKVGPQQQQQQQQQSTQTPQGDYQEIPKLPPTASKPTQKSFMLASYPPPSNMPPPSDHYQQIPGPPASKE